MFFGKKMAAAEKAKELQSLRATRMKVEGEKKLDMQISAEKRKIRDASASERSKKVKGWLKKGAKVAKARRKKHRNKLGKPSGYGAGGSEAQEYFAGTSKKRKKQFWE